MRTRENIVYWTSTFTDNLRFNARIARFSERRIFRALFPLQGAFVAVVRA